jgi:hypothetical protein
VPTRIVRTAFRILQHNEKNSFRIKETCTRRHRAHRSTARRRGVVDMLRPRARQRACVATPLRRIVKATANWALHPCRKIRAQPVTHGLTAFATTRRRRCAASPTAIFAAKKIVSTSLRKAAPTRIGSARAIENDPNRFQPIRKTGRADRSGKRLRGAAEVFDVPILVRRGSSERRRGRRAPRDPARDAGANAGIRDRASP